MINKLFNGKLMNKSILIKKTEKAQENYLMFQLPKKTRWKLDSMLDSCFEFDV